MAKSRSVLGVQVLANETRLLLADVDENGLTPVEMRVVSGVDALTKSIRSLPKRPSAVVCAVPMDQGAIRILSLPPTTEENLDRVVALEAETALPLGAEDLALAHHMLGMTEQSRLEVLLAAARQSAVQNTLKVVNCAPYISAQATLSSIALVNALQNARGPARENVCAILNVEETDSELLVLDRIRVIAAQSLPSGSRHAVPEPEPQLVGVAAGAADAAPASGLGGPVYPWIQQLAPQIRYALQAMSYERGLTLERLYVCGSGAVGTNVDWQLSEALDIPVSILGPGTPEGDASYAVAYGCAVQAAGRAAMSLNLTPARVTIAREVEQRRQNTLSWGALAGAGVVAAGLVFAAALHRQGQAVAAAERRLAEVSALKPPTTAAPAELKTASEGVAKALTSRVPPGKLLTTLSRKLPAGTWLTELVYNSETGAVLRGLSTDDAGPGRTQIAMLQEGLFDEVTPDFQNEDLIGATRVWSFQITCKLRPPEVKRRATTTPSGGASSR